MKNNRSKVMREIELEKDVQAVIVPEEILATPIIFDYSYDHPSTGTGLLLLRIS